MVKHVRSILGIAAIVIVVGAVSSEAQAQYGFDGWGRLGAPYGVLPGSGWFEMPYSTGRIPTPPYFALHPPVYYSNPEPRTYGYSPYAYPGTFMTPEIVEPPQAEEIINPHVTPSSETEATEAKDKRVAQAQPQMIINPYVAYPDKEANVELARLKTD
jgi:hypothetical protein